MTPRSAAELEREAEAARTRMIETAHTLQDRLTPGRIVDELGTYLKHSDGSIALQNMKNQVRDNPLPLALIGTGLAWLFMGGGTGSTRPDTGRPARPDGPDTDAVWQDAGGLPRTGVAPVPKGGQGQPSVKDKAGGAMSAASRAAGSVTEKLSSTYTSVEERASNTRRSMSEGGQHLGERARATGHSAMEAGTRAQRMVGETLHQEPIILGALGIALGAALGALMPRTRMEEDYLRPYEERAGEQVKETARQGLDSAKDVAETAYRAGKEEAERHKPGAEGSGAAGRPGKAAGAAPGRGGTESPGGKSAR